eukprot:m.9124 g.9124  ORF g.9124 m.9124 type:complete len:59 (-) comp9364_c0_seq1:40-216(-)
MYLPTHEFQVFSHSYNSLSLSTTTGGEQASWCEPKPRVAALHAFYAIVDAILLLCTAL